MEEGKIRIIRHGKATEFPSDFVFVGATNPCPCGYFGDNAHTCKCTMREIQAYRSKLSGPLADRIDICIEISRVNYRDLRGKNSLSSEEMKEKIAMAREIQKQRFKDYSFKYNGQMEDKYAEEFCNLGKSEKAFIKDVYIKQNISPRRYYRVLKVARTIADVRGIKNVNQQHISAAIHYTRFLEEASNSSFGENRGGQNVY
jgi:magnesium chelatase family protein